MILHIDMDAFYASVEERENPALRGKPVAVAGRAEDRGVVAAANYVSRQYGVHSAMPTSVAIRKCPHLTIVKPRGELYSAVSAQIRDIFERYTPEIEPLSLDEAFLDPIASRKLHGEAEDIGRKIKADIARELSLVASVGVAPNKFLAKLASDHDKPDGFTVIHETQVQDFLDPLPVSRIWGVGSSALGKLNGMGIFTIADLRLVSRQVLDERFGKYGERLWNLSRGRDARRVETQSRSKSVSHETTFSSDIADFTVLEQTLMGLVESVGARLRRAGLQGRTINLKVRFDDFQTITRSRSLPRVTADTSVIWATARDLLKDCMPADFAVRLIGVGVSGFDFPETSQQDLFEQVPTTAPLDELSDSINQRFGKHSLRRGTSVRKTT